MTKILVPVQQYKDHPLAQLESIRRGNFTKYLFLGDGLLENRICS